VLQSTYLKEEGDPPRPAGSTDPPSVLWTRYINNIIFLYLTYNNCAIIAIIIVISPLLPLIV
jgi:hypothetical protein